MNRHKCSEQSNSSDSKTPATLAQKQLIAEKLTMLCIKDSRPFEMVSGEGFLQYTQAVIDMVRGCDSHIDAKTLLAHPTTISRKTSEIKKLCVRKLAEILLNMEKDLIGMAYTADIWTDNTNQVI
jgi:hypothetical protein